MAGASLCLLLILGPTFSAATRIDSVCTAVPTAKGIARPEIPNLFRVDVECTMQEQNRSIFVREYFDYGNNRGRITQTDLLTTGDAFFDYNANEIILIDVLTSGCEVGDLALSDNRWMFGYKNKDHGEPHVFGASGALHFGNSPEEYMGRNVVRGIIVNQWDSCQYSEELNATMKVTWYFSAKTEWDMQLGDRSVPIRVTAIGKQYKYGQIVPFNHTYDLYKFEPYVHTYDFEIPEGIVCPGRIKTKPFPTMPNRFSLIGEVLDHDRQVVTYMEESYDTEAKINVFRYKRDEDASTVTSMDRMLQVNDYNSGVSYIIDTLQDSCQITQLGFGGYAFVHYLNHGMVQMMTPAEFISGGSLTQYTYAGVRTSRDIPCEVWVASTDKIVGFTDRNLTVEWYFAISDDEKWSTGSEYRLPVQFRMWTKGLADPIWDYNVYYYDLSRPQLISADISPCFHGAERRRFTFDIDKKDQGDVFNNLEMFKYALTSAVSLFTGISQMRVADIHLYYDLTAVHVMFDMLDKPNIAGDVYNITLENDLASAVQLYNDAMSSGNLQLSVVVGTDVKTIKPLLGSSSEVTAPQSTGSGFTTGALAGLGVGMLLVGSAGGAAGAFFFFR